jgi:hypothetical protein
MNQVDSWADELEPATVPLVSLDDIPHASARVKQFAADVETAPVAALQLGHIYEDIAEANDLSTEELQALVPALLLMLDDRRRLAPAPGYEETASVLRVCDRAELVLELLAGMPLSGEDRQRVWEEWWSRSREEPRPAWLLASSDDFETLLNRWPFAADYVQSLDARKALEIAARTGNESTLPALMDLLRNQLPEAATTNISIPAMLTCVGELATSEQAVELLELARKLNDAQRACEPEEYTDALARRSDALRAFASTLDRLTNKRLGSEALESIGPPEHGACAIRTAAFDDWLQASRPL